MFDVELTRKEIMVKEYKTGMERLMKIMPRKKLKRHLSKWIVAKLSLEDKLFEVRMLLLQYK